MSEMKIGVIVKDGGTKLEVEKSVVDDLNKAKTICETLGKFVDGGKPTANKIGKLVESLVVNGAKAE